MDYTTNAIAYTFYLAGPNGAAYILYPYQGASAEEVAKAEQEIRNSYDAVSVRLATEDDRDKVYVEAIFREPAIRPLKWYEINTNDEMIRTERKKGTTPLQYVEWYVLPLIAQTRLANARIYQEVRNEIEDSLGYDVLENEGKDISGCEIEAHDQPKRIDELRDSLESFEQQIESAIRAEILRINCPVTADQLGEELFRLEDGKKLAFLSLDESNDAVIHQTDFSTKPLSEVIGNNQILHWNMIRLLELLLAMRPQNHKL